MPTFAQFARALATTFALAVSAHAATVEPVTLIGCDACAAAKREANAGSLRAVMERAASHRAHAGPSEIEQLLADDRAANTTSTDLISYNLDIAIDPTASTISGSNTLSFVALQAISTVQIRLNSVFTVNTASGVQVNGVNSTFTRSGITMTVNLGRTYAVGEAFNVKVTYSGVPASGGLGSITFRTRSSGAREAFSLSETDFAYTWFPAKENNTDKCVADLRFTVPDTMKAVSNGTLQSVTPASGGRATYYWKTNYPTATYLFSFSVTNFNEYSQTWNFTPTSGPSVSMPLSFWLYPESDTLANRNAWFNSANMLTAYSRDDRFGLYAFTNEKYGIYQFGFGGGMEHQTCTGQGVFDESVTAHELGHQWWGDNVTCATWNHIWLNEGFATYTEALWEQWKPGSSGLQALKNAMAARRPSTVNGTVYCPSTTDQNRIFSTDFSYRKGGWTLHMLRGVMGDTNFFQALRNYRAQYGGGSATTEEFQAVCEAVYGSSLNYFFQQWVYQPGAPTYQIGWQNVVASGQNYVEVYFNQTQSATYPRYTMPLDMRLTPAVGPITTQKVTNSGATQYLLIPVSGQINNLQIDPDVWVLSQSLGYIGFPPNGPPKVVATVPAIASSSVATAVPSVSITFHEDVNAAAGQFTLTGPGGSVPFTFAYDAPNFRATLTPTAPLAPGAYTVTAAQTITAVAGGIQLDGETPSTSNPGSNLPSGNGVAGGAFTMNFTLTAPPPPACVGDLNGDNSVNTADLTSFLGQFGSIVTPGTGADLNNDGAVNTSDLTLFLGAFGLPCP
jgi:hypothetical protein